MDILENKNNIIIQYTYADKISVYLCEELQVLLHKAEVGLVHQPGVQELVTGGACVVRPVARQQQRQRDAAGAIAWVIKCQHNAPL